MKGATRLKNGMAVLRMQARRRNALSEGEIGHHASIDGAAERAKQSLGGQHLLHPANSPERRTPMPTMITLAKRWEIIRRGIIF